MLARVVAFVAVSGAVVLAATGDVQRLTLVALVCTAASLAVYGPTRRQLLAARGCATAGVLTALAALSAGVLPQFAFPLLALATAAGCRSVGRDTAADALALVAASSIALALGGHALQFRPYFATSNQMMSLTTVLVLLMLCIGVLLAHPGRGLMRYVRNHGSAGRIVRYLLPIPFLLPYVSSAVMKWGVEHRVGDPVVIFWAFALFNTAASALLIFAAVQRLSVAELERVAAHNALRRANDELERRVRERTEELAAANAALAATNAELEQFAYLSAHDLQEPLRIVRVYAQLLERRAPGLSGEVREHLHTVVGAVERMQVLVRDVQTYSEALHTSPTYGVVDLRIVVERATQRLAGMILSAKADLRYGELPPVRGSADQLETVFVHLFNNALKFRSDERPRIRITATPCEEQCEVRVSDNGIGISPAYHERIFGLFKRLHAGKEGTGLGLALCKRIITAHGGRIWVTSSLGEGATFHFTLPAADTGHQPVRMAVP